MALKKRSREAEADPFYDMLFNMLIAFVFCFIIAMLAFNPKAHKSGDIPAKAEYIVTLSWPDNNPNDIDTWMQDPADNILWFRQRDIGLMHLDRDDRGASNNTVVVNGRAIVNPIRQEMATIRGIVPGEYVVNAHYYDSKDGKPVDVTVSVVKVNPKADVVYYGTTQLPAKGEERTLVRFTLDSRGEVLNINTLQKKFVQRSGL